MEGKMNIGFSGETCHLCFTAFKRVRNSHEGNLSQRKLWVSVRPKNPDGKQWNQFLQGEGRGFETSFHYAKDVLGGDQLRPSPMFLEKLDHLFRDLSGVCDNAIGSLGTRYNSYINI